MVQVEVVVIKNAFCAGAPHARRTLSPETRAEWLARCKQAVHHAEAAVRGAARFNDRVQVRSHELISELKHMAEKDKEYIYKAGAGMRHSNSWITWPLTDISAIDPEGTFDVPKFE